MPDRPGELSGILFIGDPHLASRAPGFRRDDYPQVVMDKLLWALDYARDQRLLPVLLGDLFDYPRDNANWMLVKLLNALHEVCAVAGNHDMKENQLGDNDTLAILVAARAIRLLDDNPWLGVIGGRPVRIGGASWGRRLPDRVDPDGRLVFWVAHHDIRFPGYEEEGRLDCRPIAGIDCIVNGHLHRDLGRVQSGPTLWINPGNLTRVARTDASAAHKPGVLRIDIFPDRFDAQRIEAPHLPFDQAFHPGVRAESIETPESPFIADLSSVRTASGAGLRQFLEASLGQFDARVAHEIQLLAKEVLDHDDP